MKKNNIFLSLCVFVSVFSCDECQDNAEEISRGRKDTHENYIINPKAYSNYRNQLMGWGKNIFNDTFSIDTNILPESVKDFADNINGFYYVNTNITLRGFFHYCLQEVICIDLLIEKVNNISLKENFKTYLNDGWNGINGILEKIKTKGGNNGNNNIENQISYSLIFELNKTFNDEVLKKILPEIVETNIGIFGESKDEFEKHKILSGKAHILLCKLDSYKTNENRERELGPKWNKAKKNQK